MRYEIRLAQKGETLRQKEIWKDCFGDSDQFIDFFYATRYKEDATALLLQDGEILAMLTMLPIKLITPDLQSIPSTMLYAIATHPQYQHRGLATQLMNFSHKYLAEHNTPCSVLVPADQQLFAFYHKQGYQEGFDIRETLYHPENIEPQISDKATRGFISGITPVLYNQRRNKLLSGKLYIAYPDEDIAYQKKLSQLSGADIYSIEIGEMQGCAVIERVNADKVFIKELLMEEELLPVAIHLIAQLLPAKEYFIRTPAFLGKNLDGSTCRPLGMLKINSPVDVPVTAQAMGYLGLAFD